MPNFALGLDSYSSKLKKSLLGKNMFESLKYRYRLWKYRRSKRKTEKLYDSEFKKAKDRKEENRVAHEAMHFISEEERNIRELQTEYLCNIAKALIIPIDSQDEYWWDKVDSSPSQILSQKGIYELKKLIRNERKESREIVFSWITIIMGLIGTLIGLVSVLRN